MHADTRGLSSTREKRKLNQKKYKYTWKWMPRIPLQNVLVVPLIYCSYLKSSNSTKVTKMTVMEQMYAKSEAASLCTESQVTRKNILLLKDYLKTSSVHRLSDLFFDAVIIFLKNMKTPVSK